MNFEKLRKERQEYLESVIRSQLPEEEGYQQKVIQAMNYSILSGGKRIRPMLMDGTYRVFGGRRDVIKPFLAAVEMIHTYSLIHDDLPAMDNDEYRRGRKTTHVVYGEAMAILAGDALLNYGFETAGKAFYQAESGEELKRVGDAIMILGRKAGIYGMIGGQTADILAEEEGANITSELLLFIHEHKTAALFQCAMMIGAVLAGASEKETEAVEKAAYNIGVAFQIQDDILDVTGSFEDLGKPIGSDEKNHKLTYVRLNGIDRSRKMVKEMTDEAVSILRSFHRDEKQEEEFLILLIQSLINRKN